MNPRGARVSYTFGPGLSALGKRLLYLYGGVYVLELLLEHWLHVPVSRHLFLWPFGSPDFRVWQLVTCLFVHDPQSPILFLIQCLMLYFFSGPVENALGPRRFLAVFFGSGLGGVLCGFLFSAVSSFRAPFGGMMPSLLSLMVVYGFCFPGAVVLLMFVLPLKARYISYGTILVTALTFLAKANPSGAFQLGGILFGYAVFRGPVRAHELRLLYLKFLEWRLTRKKARFKVIEGGKGKQGKGPTYH